MGPQNKSVTGESSAAVSPSALPPSRVYTCNSTPVLLVAAVRRSALQQCRGHP
ncbi:unnamed protein product, partial [Pleuronectes platessa]